MSKVPVTIFTGFLGSGKTTIISHLIETLQAQQQQVVYIKNEIGSEDIDSQLLKGQHIQTKELLNGCICCTLVGPFMAAASEVITTFHPSRIIIEASGAAEPAALALMVSSHPQLIRDGVISIIDVVNFKGYHDLSLTAQHQTQFTDLIVFNKVELVDLEQKQAVVGYVRELNTTSPIVEAPQGHLPPELVFGLRSSTLDTALAELENHDHQHLAHDHLSAISLEVPENIDQGQLTHWLQLLPKEVFRVKGIIKTSQGVLLINKVGQRLDINPLTSSQMLPSKLVMIGFDLTDLTPSLQLQLSHLSSGLQGKESALNSSLAGSAS